VGEDRVAICPKFGCEYMTRVKPLKFKFLGFGKYPKCKKHHIPLVYVDERIGDFVDAALACFFDKSALPPNDLLIKIKSKFSDDFEAFVKGWIYCIKVGRGAPIVSRYMDTISNGYLKQLTKKQVKIVKNKENSISNFLSDAIKVGLDEIIIQYTRILKQIRAHSEIFSKNENLKPLSKKIYNYLNEWQKERINYGDIIKPIENPTKLALEEVKLIYDQILNIYTCRSLLGLNPESKEIKIANLTPFDRYSAYYEFYIEGLTSKFTKSDVINLIKGTVGLVNHKSDEKMKYDSMEKIDYLALKYYREFIKNQILNLDQINFISKDFLEKLAKLIKKYLGDLPDNRIAEILYGTSNGSEALAFATLKNNKNKKPNSLIDEKIIDHWFSNLKLEFSNNFNAFFNVAKAKASEPLDVP
jgi:hypothetical protein